MAQSRPGCLKTDVLKYLTLHTVLTHPGGVTGSSNRVDVSAGRRTRTAAPAPTDVEERWKDQTKQVLAAGNALDKVFKLIEARERLPQAEEIDKEAAWRIRQLRGTEAMIEEGAKNGRTPGNDRAQFLEEITAVLDARLEAAYSIMRLGPSAAIDDLAWATTSTPALVDTSFAGDVKQAGGDPSRSPLGAKGFSLAG